MGEVKNGPRGPVMTLNVELPTPHQQRRGGLKFEKGKRYLVIEDESFWPRGELIEVKVMEISKTAIKLKYLSGGVVWETKEEVGKYKIVEKL